MASLLNCSGRGAGVGREAWEGWTLPSDVETMLMYSIQIDIEQRFRLPVAAEMQTKDLVQNHVAKYANQREDGFWRIW